eukprot:CAMPEP_0198143584 /NCGR_PEP_ID=MMETSP1443-20131203/8556_1 /TAXON_ID=186043 /ORGANISM="Entomoneis sp., Strain CCMP2396" /LENGTH=72 /DNA_ID=CAMNT_0043806847 /DNA_START=108 /DNA_END=323 /DNA_ORIENTATION=+
MKDSVVGRVNHIHRQEPNCALPIPGLLPDYVDGRILAEFQVRKQMLHWATPQDFASQLIFKHQVDLQFDTTT